MIFTATPPQHISPHQDIAGLSLENAVQCRQAFFYEWLGSILQDSSDGQLQIGIFRHQP